MARIQHLSLIFPAVFARMRAAQAQGQLPELPALENILRASQVVQAWPKGDRHYAQLDSWQYALLAALERNDLALASGSAALSWQGEGSPSRGGTYLHAELVHLAAGLDHLQLVTSAAASAEDLQQLFASVRTAFTSAGFELLHGSSGNEYAWSARRLELQTYSPRNRGHELYDLMPVGADAGELRRLMTELQMLLHQHPINSARERRGELPLNAVWFWGAGESPLPSKIDARHVFASRAYAQGLCAHLQIDCKPAPSSVQDLLARAPDRVIAVIDTPEDLETWDATWLQAVRAALARGEIRSLELFLEEHRVTANGGVWSAMKNSLKPARPRLPELLT